jgi:hypothetical protein
MKTINDFKLRDYKNAINISQEIQIQMVNDLFKQKIKLKDGEFCFTERGDFFALHFKMEDEPEELYLFKVLKAGPFVGKEKLKENNKKLELLSKVQEIVSEYRNQNISIGEDDMLDVIEGTVDHLKEEVE